MAMKSFTAMSNDGIKAVISASRETNDPYAMTLNHSDLESLLWALQAAHDAPDLDEETVAWAGSFAGGIAQTLGIEFI